MDKKKLKELIDKIENYLREHQTAELSAHSLRTADYAVYLNNHLNLGLDESKIRLAGLLHDIAKEYPQKKLFEIAAEKGYVFDDIELESPALMHARIGSIESERIFGITDPDIHSAIIKHTTGSSGMSQLDLLIFAADKIEPGREYKGVDDLRECIRKNFYRGCHDILESQLKYVSDHCKTVHPAINDAISELQTTIFFMDEIAQKTDEDSFSDSLSMENIDDELENTESDDTSVPQSVAFVRSLMSLNSWIIACCLFAMIITFLGSVFLGFVSLFLGIDPTGNSPLSISKPPSNFFNGRSELLFLIAGLDEVDHASRTDTLILAKLDMIKPEVRMISIPRDSLVQIPGQRGPYWDRINAAYTRGGNERLLDTIDNLIGIYPDYLVLMKYDGFKSIVDLVGGVEIDVDKDMNYDDYAGNLHIHLKKGLQKLYGEDALGYVRFRHEAEGDFARIRRQQNFAREMLRKIASYQGVTKANSIITAIMDNVDIVVIDPYNPEKRIKDQKMTINQYLTLARVLVHTPPENISAQSVKIAREGIVERKSVLFIDYKEFDIMMSEFFAPSGLVSSNLPDDKNLISSK